ncbi:YciI family protein [Plantactinospora sp. B6F1]|uniref:YciI family protein n=1 Tax=Plantactinospora sp. B6F1 TaxID=3158971 RepID=UPI0032D8F9B5
MQQYLLSIYQPDGEPPGPEILDPVMQNLAALNQEMKAAGAWVFSAGLHPASTATVLRPRDGEILMTDGPYTEGKEHLGGFTVIRAPDLDAALEWGGKLARAIGLLPIEVRPLADEADSCDPPGV